MTTDSDDSEIKFDPEKVAALPAFDVAEHLDSPEVIAAYLSDFFAEGDPAIIAEALRDVARAKGMPEVAAKSGLARESLYKALRPGSQPRLETILRVLKALGLQLAVLPISDVGNEADPDDSKV